MAIIRGLAATVLQADKPATVVVPATPAGYITVQINGTNRKLPYY